MNSSWGKGYLRKGAALHGAKRYDDAIAAYEAGIKVEDSPALRKGLQDVKDAKGLLHFQWKRHHFVLIFNFFGSQF